MRACPPSGRGRGTGPDGDKFRRGGTQETLGGAEAKRSPEEGLCPALAKRPDIKKKPAKNLFLVGLKANYPRPIISIFFQILIFNIINNLCNSFRNFHLCDLIS